jgi:hypothetical protein
MLTHAVSVGDAKLENGLVWCGDWYLEGRVPKKSRTNHSWLLPASSVTC